MEALFIIICRYPLRFSSKITVNGPSFSRDTFISAPKIPCSTTGTCLLASEIIYSYNLFASSGAPASMKLGRFPLRQFAYKVNCETKSNSPFTSARDKLVFPFSSSKIRKSQKFFQIPVCIFPGIPTANADQNKKSFSNFSNCFSIYFNFCMIYTLNYKFHRLFFLRLFFCFSRKPIYFAWTNLAKKCKHSFDFRSMLRSTLCVFSAFYCNCLHFCFLLQILLPAWATLFRKRDLHSQYLYKTQHLQTSLFHQGYVRSASIQPHSEPQNRNADNHSRNSE